MVVCDIGLPGLDGFEVARVLRADPVAKKARLVALTAYAGLDDRTREAGFDRYMIKPAPVSQLLWTLEELTRWRT